MGVAVIAPQSNTPMRHHAKVKKPLIQPLYDGGMMTRLYDSPHPHGIYPVKKNRQNKQNKPNRQSRNWALIAFSTAMVFLSVISTASARQSDVSLGPLGDLTFEGIYLSLKAGFVSSHESGEAFSEDHIMSVEEDGSSITNTTTITAQTSRKSKNGFGAHWAIGTRIDWSNLLWTRSELEVGFHRYRIQSQINQSARVRQVIIRRNTVRDNEGNPIVDGNGRPTFIYETIESEKDLSTDDDSLFVENDRVQMISVLWNNLFHPFPMHSDHQIWAGLGLGGDFVRIELSHSRQGEFGLQKANSSGTNFLAVASLGYDYRILKRSQFLMKYLRLGFNARYLVSEGYRAERRTQFMMELSYGF